VSREIIKFTMNFKWKCWKCLLKFHNKSTEICLTCSHRACFATVKGLTCFSTTSYYSDGSIVAALMTPHFTLDRGDHQCFSISKRYWWTEKSCYKCYQQDYIWYASKRLWRNRILLRCVPDKWRESHRTFVKIVTKT